MNMYNWVKDIINTPRKKAMPVLSFPSIQILGITVMDLLSDSSKLAEGMRLVAERTDAAAALSMMDLSVEAECFGSNIRFADSEVPTVVGGIISSYEEAQKLAVPKVGVGRTGNYIKAIRKAAEIIKDRPVFSGVIGPFSLAGRLMDVSDAMIYCYDEPEMVHLILERVTSFLIDYIKAYKEVGANGVLTCSPKSSPLIMRKI